MRILIQPRLGIRDTHQLQQFLCPRPSGFGRHTQMQQQRLANLEADGQHRIQRRHRILKNHRDIAPAYGAHGIFTDRQQIAAFKQNAPVRNTP